MKSLFHPLERTFHRLERMFHRLKCTFHQLEHKFHHREKTFIALCYNNLSTMFQQCCNVVLFDAYNRGEKSSFVEAESSMVTELLCPWIIYNAV